MPKPITITVAGEPRELQAEYLSDEAFTYWCAWLAYRAQLAYNPLVEFLDKLAVVPKELHSVALAGLLASFDPANVPAIYAHNVMRSTEAMQVLCRMVTGCDDVVDAVNTAEAFQILMPFVHREEMVVASIEEANRLRAEVGKPPIGG